VAADSPDCHENRMKILEPVVHLVGQLSFRNKLRVTALVFGLPLLAMTTALLLAINGRVSGLEQERAALALQVPTLSLIAHLNQVVAASQGEQEGAVALGEVARAKRVAAVKAVEELRIAAEAQGIWPAKKVGGDAWLGRWAALSRQIENADAEGISQLGTALHGELERLNEASGLLSDGDAASSRLLDVMTAHLPGLLESTGQVARIGTVVLIKQSVRGSKRSDLTLHRGNFDALVMWSMESLRKVAQEHPELVERLDSASGQLNTAFAALQESITIKMLETTDFAMTPAAYLLQVDRSFAETLAVAGTLASASDTLLAARLDALTLQRNVVMAVIALTLLLVLAGFVAAYISIMRGLNGLSDAVETMAAGDLDARVKVTSKDELGDVGERFNEMAASLAERTVLLREKTNDIHSMLQNLPQGILTIAAGGCIHPEYSSYLETIFEQHDLAGQPALELLCADADIGADALDQSAAAIAACLGEERMNFEFNAHLLLKEIRKTMPDGRVKILEFLWAPICDENDVVEKIMVCVRDVSELRQLAAESEHQKRELEMIGQILAVNQEKFHEFIASARQFIVENEQLLQAAQHLQPELVTQLFRNMHTIKGNARTYGLLHLTNLVHEAEQAYDALRQNPAAPFEQALLLQQLAGVSASVEEYASLNEVTLGRKGPGRRGSAEKYLMIKREQLDSLLVQLDAYDLHACHQETLAALLAQVKLDLRLVGTESIGNILQGVFDSLPSLARELGKTAPVLQVEDAGIQLRNQVADLLRNVFMHLYRNALDHGIDLPEARLAEGKPAAGSICLRLALDQDHLCLRLQDDGRGLALARIRDKAREKGLLDDGKGMSDEMVVNLIFAAGFSTAARVTEVSGRGVGMDAVQSFVKREGGQIRLHLLDAKEGADFRSFETIIELPAKFAVAGSSSPYSTLQHPAHRHAEHVDGGYPRRDLPGMLPAPAAS
jgi:two-component system, chemotaxis family, sensor kinase CheA